MDFAHESKEIVGQSRRQRLCSIRKGRIMGYTTIGDFMLEPPQSEWTFSMFGTVFTILSIALSEAPDPTERLM
jgi:hypothetical protein